MTNKKDIRNEIVNIKNIQKLTKAMEMVAASKMRKSQDLILSSNPYLDAIRKIINRLANSTLEYKHPYLVERSVKRVGYLVISTNCGLCGNLNINLFKKLLTDIETWKSKDVISDLIIIGRKGSLFLKSIDSSIIAQFTNIKDNTSSLELFDTIQIMLHAYDKYRLDKLYIVNNKFINSMHYTPIITQLLPFVAHKDNAISRHKFWDYIYETKNQKFLLDMILRRYVKSQIYHSVLENLASEQASRMIAMKSATDNGGKLVKKMNLIYNKARQASITQELSEIVSGAICIV